MYHYELRLLSRRSHDHCALRSAKPTHVVSVTGPCLHVVAGRIRALRMRCLDKTSMSTYSGRGRDRGAPASNLQSPRRSNPSLSRGPTTNMSHCRCFNRCCTFWTRFSPVSPTPSRHTRLPIDGNRKDKGGEEQAQVTQEGFSK